TLVRGATAPAHGGRTGGATRRNPPRPGNPHGGAGAADHDREAGGMVRNHGLLAGAGGADAARFPRNRGEGAPSRGGADPRQGGFLAAHSARRKWSGAGPRGGRRGGPGLPAYQGVSGRGGRAHHVARPRDDGTAP